MKLIEVLNAANMYYPDGYLCEYYDKDGKFKKDGSGDALAEFIVIEIIETFNEMASDSDQIDEAIRVLENGRTDLNDAIKGLEESVR